MAIRIEMVWALHRLTNRSDFTSVQAASTIRHNANVEPSGFKRRLWPMTRRAIDAIEWPFMERSGCLNGLAIH